MSVFEDGVCLTKEVIDEQGQTITWSWTPCLFSILIDQSVDGTWHRVISQVGLILFVELLHHHTSLFKVLMTTNRLSWTHFTVELWWVVTKRHKTAFVHLSCDSLGSLGIFLSSLLAIHESSIGRHLIIEVTEAWNSSIFLITWNTLQQFRLVIILHFEILVNLLQSFQLLMQEVSLILDLLNAHG